MMLRSERSKVSEEYSSKVKGNDRKVPFKRKMLKETQQERNRKGRSREGSVGKILKSYLNNDFGE